MPSPPNPTTKTQSVSNFEDLVAVDFDGEINAICWKRELVGNFEEIVGKLTLHDDITVIEAEDLLKLQLSEAGQLAREIILNDLNLLKAYGAAPVLNLLKCYERDTTSDLFSTDVYSFHVDRSPIPTNTFLCTYYGEPSEIIPNSQAEQIVLVPEISDELKKLFSGPDEEFDVFLSEHFYDLHYRAKPDASPISLGKGNLWRLAVDHPESKVPPCIHRAPKENPGEYRLLLIC